MKKAKVSRLIGGLIILSMLATVGCGKTENKTAMKTIEVLGGENFEDETGNMKAEIYVPDITIKNIDGTVDKENTEVINTSIKEYTDGIIQQYKADMELMNNSEQEENADDVTEPLTNAESIRLDYTIVTDSDKLLSLKFDESIVMASSAQSVKTYNISKETGKIMTLPDLFKADADYRTVISNNIKEQMKAQMEEDENVTYWLDSEVPEWDFDSISDDTTFYINQDGNLTIVFDEGEVAPMSMGVVEFEIPADAIQDIVLD